MNDLEHYKLKIFDKKGNIYDFASVIISTVELEMPSDRMTLVVKFQNVDIDKFYDMIKQHEESKRRLETLKVAGMGRRALDFTDGD